MKQRGKRPDFARLLAVLVVITAIVYFYSNIFAPRLIPQYLRVGMIRQPLTLLVLGTDITFDAKTRQPMPEKRGRADTILLARLDPINSRVSVLSIPRDTYIEVKGFGKMKINAVNAYGGAELMKTVIAGLVDRKIDNYVEIKPSAVTRMVDILGGVTIDVEKDMYYTDRAQGLKIDLKKGRQRLSGKEAHDYIRFRYDIRGDIARIERQQKFLKALSLSLVSPANFFKAPFAIHTAFQEVETDLPLSKMVRLLNWSRTLGRDSLKTQTLPGEPSFINEIGAGSVWLPDGGGVNQVVQEMF